MPGSGSAGANVGTGMQALRLFPEGMRSEDVPVPVPQGSQVRLKVAGAGACHSDLHVVEAAAHGKLPWAMPFTLGHEIAGWVDQLGPDATGVKIGDAVAVYCAWGCGQCAACRAGSDNYCENFSILRGAGLGIDGGMAPFALVPDSRYLVPLAQLDPVDAAPLADAGITAYHAVKRSLPLLVDDSICAIVGIGGLGHLAIQIVRALAPAARIIAVDQASDKLDLAREMGADMTLTSSDDTLSHMRDLTAGRRADVVLDFVGAQSTMDFARKAVRSNGEVTLVGLAGGTLPVRQGSIAYGARVSMTFYGSIADLHETLELARRGAIRAHVSRYPLERADEAFAAMRDGSLTGRAVICPNGCEPSLPR